MKVLIILNCVMIIILSLLLFTVWISSYVHNNVAHNKNSEDTKVLKEILVELKSINWQEVEVGIEVEY